MATIVVPVSRKDIWSGKLDAVDVIIGAATAELRKTGLVTSCTLALSGFGRDSRRPFEMPEFRAWCKAAHRSATAFIACALDTPALTLFLCSLLDVDITREGGRPIVRIRPGGQVERYVSDVIERIVSVCEVEGRRHDAALLCDETLDRIGSAINFDAAQSGITHNARNVAIARQAVVERDVDDVVSFLRAAVRECGKRGSITPWTLTLSGFEDDPRALFEIPEVRTWCGTVHDKCTTFAACALDTASLSWYLSSLVAIDVVRAGQKTRLRVKSSEQVEAYARQAAERVTEVCARVKRSPEEAVELVLRTIDRIGEALHVDLSSLTPEND